MISVFEESSLLYTYKNYKVKDLSKSVRNKCFASQLGTQVYDTERAKICSKSWFYCKRNYAVFQLTSEVRTSWLKLSISNLKVLQVHKAKSNQKHGCLCTLCRCLIRTQNTILRHFLYSLVFCDSSTPTELCFQDTVCVLCRRRL